MNIGILGGGVGGLSAAIALTLEGFNVVVYERHEKPIEIGAGIVCWPNASFVLDQIGVLDKISNVSGSLSRMNRFSHLGTPMGSLDIKELNRLMGYPSYSVVRKDLMSILIQRAVELGIDIQYQHDAIELSDKNIKTKVQFSHGKSIEPDVVIGADGRMNSLARKYVNGCNTPIYQGFINWVGVFKQESPSFKDLSVSDYWGVGKRFGVVPVSDKKAYWAGGIASTKIERTNPQEYKSELDTIFNDWPDIIGRVIAGTPVSHINKIYVHDHDPIGRWHKNNVVLLGDAAHSPLPTSGQGACQALEDSWHLSKCLKVHVNDISNAFTAYTELRQSKTSGITIGGRQLATSIFNRNEDFCKQRNLASQNTDYEDVVVGMARGWSSGLPIGAQQH